MEEFKIESNLESLKETLAEKDFERVQSLLNDSEALLIVGMKGIDKDKGSMGMFVSKINVVLLATIFLSFSKIHPNLINIVNKLLLLKMQGREKEIIGELYLDNRSRKNRDKDDL